VRVILERKTAPICRIKITLTPTLSHEYMGEGDMRARRYERTVFHHSSSMSSAYNRCE
jgi:hypothetical protein